MSQSIPKSKDVRAKLCMQRWMPLLILAILLTSCINAAEEIENGIVFIASRGKRPVAQSIAWSPIDENKVLIRAYETPSQPAEVYILDVQTGEKELVVGPLQPAQFIDAKWMPDGKYALILVVDTIGFEPSGWWVVNVSDKSVEYVLSPMDTIAWSPDGKFIAALYRKLENNNSSIELKLIDPETKVEEIVAIYHDMEYSSGISWSADSQFVVFALGRYQESSSLYIFDTVTKQVNTITEDSTSRQPSWSPKGNILVFEIDYHLHLISSDGRCETEIPDLEGVWSPTWSPDGKKLAYIASEGIYYLELDKVLGRDIYQGLCE